VLAQHANVPLTLASVRPKPNPSKFLSLPCLTPFLSSLHAPALPRKIPAAPSPDWNCQWGPSWGRCPYSLYPRHVRASMLPKKRLSTHTMHFRRVTGGIRVSVTQPPWNTGLPFGLFRFLNTKNAPKYHNFYVATQMEHDQSSYFCRGPDDFCWGHAPVGPTLVTGPVLVSRCPWISELMRCISGAAAYVCRWIIRLSVIRHGLHCHQRQLASLVV